jgi:hypothetical protein
MVPGYSGCHKIPLLVWSRKVRYYVHCVAGHYPDPESDDIHTTLLLTLSNRVVTMWCIYHLLQRSENSTICHTVYCKFCMNRTIRITKSSVSVINRLFFVINKAFVLCEVGTECLNIYQYSVD